VSFRQKAIEVHKSLMRPAWQRLEDPKSVVTGAMKRCPRLGTVAMKPGFWAESPKVSRKRVIVVFRPVSKSTNVSAGHRVDRSCSRVNRLTIVLKQFEQNLIRLIRQFQVDAFAA
jgi:hypothetical protein